MPARRWIAGGRPPSRRRRGAPASRPTTRNRGPAPGRADRPGGTGTSRPHARPGRTAPRAPSASPTRPVSGSARLAMTRTRTRKTLGRWAWAGQDGGMVLTLAGRLLVATPLLEDANFRRSVVLVLDHDEDGALGVVLNQPSEVSVSEVLDGWEPVVTGDPVLWVGDRWGPTPPSASLAGRVPTSPKAYEPCPHPGSGWSTSMPTPRRSRRSSPPCGSSPGYSGWGSGQLEEELSDGGWYVVTPSRATPSRAPRNACGATSCAARVETSRWSRPTQTTPPTTDPPR